WPARCQRGARGGCCGSPGPGRRRCGRPAAGPTSARPRGSTCSMPTWRPTRSSGWPPGSPGDKVAPNETRERAMSNRQIGLDRLPGGDKRAPEHFALRTGERPAAGDGEVLLKTRYISLDAANRAWMQGATYRSALEGGQVMAGGGLSEVVESNVGHLKP